MNHVSAFVRRLAMLCILASLAFTPSINATEVRHLSLAETVRQADAIVVGTITARQSRWGDESHRWMVTDYFLSVEDVVYSAEPIGTTIALTYWGGTIDGVTQKISDMRLPNVGERLVMMLKPGWKQQVALTPAVGFNQGLFSVRSREEGSAPLVVDAAGEPLELRVDGAIERRAVGSRTAAKPESVDLQVFTGWLRQNIAPIKAAPSEIKRRNDANDRRVIPQGPKRPARADDRVPAGLTPPVVDARHRIIPGTPPTSPGPAGQSIVARDPRETTSARRTRFIPTPSYTSFGIAHLPIVVNNFPASFAPWSPEDQYQMSKWNYYADVFRVYTTPTDTYGWPDGRFDLDGWPSSADLLRIYGSGWDANTIGVTFTRQDGSGYIIEADIALNPAFSYTLDDEWVYNGGYAEGFRQVMTHELGHMHGLDHQFNYLSVMDYMPAPFRAFGMPYMDDAQGIRVEYPGAAVSLADLGVFLYYASGYQNVSDSIYPSLVSAGGTLTVSYVHIENVGTTTISAPTIEWYLTAARNYGSAYYFLGSTTHASLAPFYYLTPSTVMRTLNVPSTVPTGDYYLGAFVRENSGSYQAGFPYSNDYAFSRNRIHVAGGGGCTSLTAPATTATAVSSTGVSLTWNASPCGTYEIYRSSAGAAFAKIGTSSVTAYTDYSAAANTAYLYAVAAVSGSSTSGLGVADLATTVTFTNSSLAPGTSLVKAIDIGELRTAVAAVRTLALQGAISFTDPVLTTGLTSVKAFHISELRSVLNLARGALGLPAASYTDATVTPGATIIKAAHINDLRNAVK